MRNKLNRLNEKIELTRANLNKLVAEKSGLVNDDAVLVLSEELDDLIVEQTRCKILLRK